MTKRSRTYVENSKKRMKTKQKPAKTRKKVKTKKNREIGSGSGKKEISAPPVEQEESFMGISELEANVLKYIVGQDKQVRQIVSAIYRSMAFDSIKANILIIGNSGTGKTATIKQIAQFLGLPCTIEDATKYTQEGYYGADVIEMIYNLIENADHDLERAMHGIIVIDEIDKKAADGDIHNPAGAEVLKSLLKIIEGTTVMVDPTMYMAEMVPFDTQNLIIIFMGAFPGLSKIRDRRLNRNSLGFVGAKPSTKLTEGYTKQDLIMFGMPEEFVGRIDTIVEMNQLGKKELIEILTKSRLSILRRYRNEYKRLGIELVFDKSLFEEIAEASIVTDTGARELSNTVNRIFEQVTYEVLSHPGKYSRCELLPGIVEDNSRYILS